MRRDVRPSYDALMSVAFMRRKAGHFVYQGVLVVVLVWMAKCSITLSDKSNWEHTTGRIGIFGETNSKSGGSVSVYYTDPATGAEQSAMMKVPKRLRRAGREQLERATARVRVHQRLRQGDRLPGVGLGRVQRGSEAEGLLLPARDRAARGQRRLSVQGVSRRVGPQIAQHRSATGVISDARRITLQQNVAWGAHRNAAHHEVTRERVPERVPRKRPISEVADTCRARPARLGALMRLALALLAACSATKSAAPAQPFRPALGWRTDLGSLRVSQATALDNGDVLVGATFNPQTTLPDMVDVDKLAADLVVLAADGAQRTKFRIPGGRLMALAHIGTRVVGAVLRPGWQIVMLDLELATVKVTRETTLLTTQDAPRVAFATQQADGWSSSASSIARPTSRP